LLACAYRSAA